ncbi:TonB-dependent receptor [Aliikangiella coralliicola]|uniref:TonB-dependent receptor n=1 Tax=Aliikangiella coralliicola TaxID=2592383 RepID=A0A545UAW1_9GAMM|nr:TonB-dependent receptor [Aliikangiella coralliicola]TQV86606.1 TonB-dependent receptor [Aliikangiella coralliicola]
MSTLDKRNPIATAVKFALFASATVSAFSAPTVFAAEEEATEEKITITGSRIKRTDVEGSLPITVIDRQQIEMSGESSAADFLRNLTFNSSGSFRPQSGSSLQGASTLSLRGIGSDRTLVLIDGRRLPKSPISGQAQDLNNIPVGAIERIEVLSDGASAVYGSDAIGGVVNVITRSDYEGAEIMLGSASVSIPDDGGDREEGYVMFGASSATSNLLGGVSWNSRDIIFQRHLPWNNPGASNFGNNFTTLDANGGDNRDYTAIPGACNFPGTGYFLRDVNGVPRCSYDFTLVSADEASTDNRSLWLKGKHEINSDWEIWANASVAKTSSFGRYAPVPDSSFFSSRLSATSPNNPTNPNGNVYDASLGLAPQEVNWWHRFDALGNRDSVVDNDLQDLQVGATGLVGDVELDFGVRRTKNRNNDIGRNFLLRSAAAELIESGAYNLADPYGSSDAVLNSMRVTTSRISKFDQNEMWVSAAFDLFELDGGTVQAFVGAEYREEIYSDQYDSLSEAGQVGGSSGNSAGGSRDVTAYYFEALAPLTDDLELNVAGRYDDYSDYGSDFSPKVSVRWQPMEEVTLRASYGEGFRAPTLDILTQKDSFSADTVVDPQTCVVQGISPCTGVQINGTVTANPSLSSEQSEQFSAGIAYQPTDWFNFTFDYFDITITDRIRQFTAQSLVDAQNRGDSIPAGLSVTRTANGAIDSVVRGSANEGELAVSGFDFNGRFNYELFGNKMATNVQWSHVSSLTVTNGDGSPGDGREQVDDPGVPADRLVISNTVELGDFSIGYNLNYIGDQYDDVNTDNNGVTTKTGHVPSWVTHDIQFNYHTAWDGKVTVGVQNAGEKFPPVGKGDVGSRDYDFELYHGYGRITYLRYTQSF